jgi:armadillo repeat-containing protein 8
LFYLELASSDTSINCQSFVANILLSFSLQGNALSAINLTQAGGIPFLARLIHDYDYEELQLPGLKCLAAMCFTNRPVSDIVCATNFLHKPILTVLTNLVSRSNSPPIQLNASKCLTYIHRSGCSELKSDDYKVVYKALPCLARLCAPEYDEKIRAEAAETLAYLAEIDSELQRLAAISNHLITNLASLLNCSNLVSKESGLKCFASLTANDETIRKRIIDMRGLIDEVLNALRENGSVKVAAVRCLHSLSRSVQLLRTTFQDHKIWKPLMNLIHDRPSSELMTVVSSTICNLLLEFSPAKESLLDSGAIEILCELTKNSNASLRLNGTWALMVKNLFVSFFIICFTCLSIILEHGFPSGTTC